MRKISRAVTQFGAPWDGYVRYSVFGTKPFSWMTELRVRYLEGITKYTELRFGVQF